jgi:alpha-1,3-rhamnosyltransferase
MSSEITIVIPSFNHEQYVEQTLASCANLVCSDRPHLLLVDDGSTDNTFQIAESYLTRTAHLFSSIRTEKRKNAGLCNSLNFALREVQTKYMLLNSSDDLFHENAIQILLSAMKADPAIAVAVGDNDFIDMAGKAIEQAANNQKFSSFLEYFISQKVGFDRSNLGKYQSFLTGNYLPVGWLVDVDKIRAIGAWDPSYKMEDWQILVRLTKKYKVDIVKELTASYRSHGTNTSKTQSIQMLFDEIRIYLQEYEYALANGYIAEWRKGLSKTRHVLKINRSFIFPSGLQRILGRACEPP